MVKVSSISITFNPDIKVLESQILELSSQVSEVVIVDNNSNNILDIENMLLNKKCTLIKLDENLGIAFAQNKGIEFAINVKASHVLLFDQDSNISNNFVSGLLQAESELLLRGDKVAAVGPRFYNERTGIKYRNTYIKNTPFLKGLILGQREFVNNEKHLESYFLIASGCLIRTSIIDIIGHMDAELFIDNVDLEWCFRAQSLGYKVFTTDCSIMSHCIGEGTINLLGRNIAIHSNIRKYYNTRNNLYLLKTKYVLLGTKVRVIPFLFLKFLIGIKDTVNLKEYFRYYYWAVVDFTKNVRGKFDH